MTVFEDTTHQGHESVHHFYDEETGLKAIIAIHSTALGPAAGGCRRWRYESEASALHDVLRLSRGMTYKNAMAGLAMGGGKAVIMADDDQPPTEETLLAFGRCVESLGGRYITSEDVGIPTGSVQILKRATGYLTGLPGAHGSAGGDPSPWTADGIFLGIQAATSQRFGNDSLAGRRIAIQGVGKVGYKLCRLLSEAGAELVVSDVDQQNTDRARAEFGARVAAPAEILYQDVDILSPNALGAILNEYSIPRIKAAVIAGAANNQLATEADGLRVYERNILYAPDYVINSGGISSVALEYQGGKTASDVAAKVAEIPGRLAEIFAASDKRQLPTNVIADAMAEAIVTDARR